MKRAALVLALFALLLAGGAGVLLYTESGLYWVLTRVAATLPGELVVARVEGRLLAGPITLHDVRYRQAEQELHVARATFRWSPFALWRATVRIEELQAQQIALHITPPAAAEAEWSVPYLPLRLEFADAQLRDVTWNAGTDSALRIDLVDADIAAAGRELRARRVVVQTADTRLDLRGAVQGGKDWSADVETRWQWQVPDSPQLAGHGRIQGGPRQLTIRQQLTAPFIASGQLTLQEPLTALSWQLHGRFENVPLHDDRAMHGTLRASGDRTLWRIEELQAAVTDGAAQLHLVADGRFDPAAPLTVTARWQDLAWPLRGHALLSSPEGTVTLHGSLDRYRYTLDTRLHAFGSEALAVTGSGRGDRRGLSVERLQASGLDGQINVNGTLHWQPRFTWQAQIAARDINPGRLWPDWPGKLAMQARSRGQYRQGWSTQLDIDKLEGRVRGVDTSLQAALRLDGRQLGISRLHLKAPDAELTADVELTDQWRAAWRVEINDLAKIIAGSRGAFSSRGQVHGPRARPLLDFALSASNLRVAGVEAGMLEASARLDLDDREASQIRLRARDLAWPGYRLRSAQLEGDGRLTQHQLLASLDLTDASMQLRAAGRYDHRHWHADVQQLDLHGGPLGDWRLRAPFTVRLGAHAAQLGAFCWTGNAARLCGEGDWRRNGSSRLALEADAFPLTLVGRLLPGTPLTGQLDGTLRAEHNLRDGLRGELTATLSPGTVGYRTPLDLAETIAHEGAQLRLRARGQRLQGQAQIALADGGSIAIQGEGPFPLLPGGPAPDPALRGTLKAELHELSLLARWVPELERPAGRLAADLEIAGTRDTPQLRGAVTLADGAVSIPRAGLTLRALQAEARSTDSRRISIAFSARSGPGQLRGDGDLVFAPDEPGSLRLRLQGKDFETVKTQNAWLLASPDLTLEARPYKVSINGQVVLPRGRLTPRDLTDAQTESPDTVVVGAAPSPPTARLWAITSNIHLDVGEEVHFEGFDFSGWVAGSIDIHDAPQRPTTGRGELRMVTGHYQVYGQRLEVERGRLIFRGGSIDDPALDVRAARRVGEVVAGVQARGTLKSPQLTLYSEPLLDQTDILSYLLLGRPASQAGAGGGDTLYRAATALGLVGGELLAKRVGTTFGIEEVRIEPGTTEASTSLVLGTYLAPRLYVSYGIGLFEAVNTWRLRYRLNKHWQIETQSGTYTGADLLYNIER